MKIIEQTWSWEQKPQTPLEIIERAARTCYKSEDRIKEGSAAKLIKILLESGHESVIEHVVAGVRFITNRGVTHELVRHRLCSFSQESTRYVRYNGEMEFIKPIWWNDNGTTDACKTIWEQSMQQAEENYKRLLDGGETPEKARDVLPHALKTEIVVTANLREWRQIFKLRCTPKAHPQIRYLMLDCLAGFAKEIPVVFDDLVSNYKLLMTND
jgi:thymidylate synthase (FAD)